MIVRYLDLLSAVLILASLISAIVSFRGQEAAVRRKWAQYRQLRQDVSDKLISQEDARHDPRYIPGQPVGGGTFIRSAELVSEELDIEIVRASRPKLTVPVVLAGIGTILAVVVALLDLICAAP